MSRHELVIEGIGPIRNPLDIGFEEGGGIVVLKGLNEAGKSTALNAMLALQGSGNALQHSDGLDRGTVTWDGGVARITVAKSTRPTGDIGVARLEGINPMLLVDPGIKDPDRADDARIRILAALTHVKLSPSQFAELIGGEEQLKAVADHKSFQQETAPEMAAAFKRDFEKAARRLEEEATQQTIIVEGIRVTIKDVDLDAKSDEAELSSATENAVRAMATAEGKASEARSRTQRVADARAKLDELARTRGGISSVEAKERLATSQAVKSARADETRTGENELTEARRVLNLAQSKLDLARERESSAAREIDSAQHALSQAVDAERAIEQAKVMAASDAGEAGPSDQELSDLRRSVDAARRRQDNGVLVRAAKSKKVQADEAERRAGDLRDQASRARDAALGCEELLTLEIQKKAPRGLRVRGGRLVMSTARSPEEIFAERSAGARTRVAVDIAIDAIGEGGILVLPQEAFEGLDPVNRAELHSHLRERKTWMLTAACTEGGPLRAEKYQPNGNGAAH